MNGWLFKLFGRKKDFALATIVLIVLGFTFGHVYNYLLLAMVLSFAAGITTTITGLTLFLEETLSINPEG